MYEYLNDTRESGDDVEAATQGTFEMRTDLPRHRMTSESGDYTSTLRQTYNLTHRDIDKYRRKARKVIPPELKRRASRYGGNARERSHSVMSSHNYSRQNSYSQRNTPTADNGKQRHFFDNNDQVADHKTNSLSSHLYRRRDDVNRSDLPDTDY